MCVKAAFCGNQEWARTKRKMSAEVNFTKRFGLEDCREMKVAFNCLVVLLTFDEESMFITEF